MRLWKRGYRHQRVPRRSSSADRRPHTGPRQRTRERVYSHTHPFPTYSYGRWSERGGTAKKLNCTTNRARPFLIRRCLAFYHPTGPELLRQKRKGARGAVSSSSDVGQERIGLRGASIGAALQAQQGARSGGGYAPSIDRCARSVLLLTRRSCSRADQLCAGTRTKHQWKTFHSH